MLNQRIGRHRRPVAEIADIACLRSKLCERFADGRYRAIATSKVLNEGVDVPDASVAIIISGSGSVREHVQRLGRILRKKEGKRAVLYELVTARTGETFTSDRRRERLVSRAMIASAIGTDTVRHVEVL